MKIVPYRKDQEFKPMTSMLNMFDEFFNRFMDEDTDSTFKAMAMDIVEHDNDFEVLANLPGMKKENIKISVHDNQLLIEAKCDEKKEEKKGTIYRCERYSGNYRRSLYLPDNANADNIVAKMDDGVLRLTIPKKDIAPKREITIN